MAIDSNPNVKDHAENLKKKLEESMDQEVDTSVPDTQVYDDVDTEHQSIEEPVSQIAKLVQENSKVIEEETHPDEGFLDAVTETINEKVDSDLDVLNSLVVDLSSLNIQEANLIERNSNIEAALDAGAAFQVIALRSGYSTSMGSLTFKDKDILRNSNLDPKNERKQLYKIIHNKMSNTSIGELSFSEFINITAYDDIETLLFGIFSQTYPGNTNFTITCGHCSAPVDIEITPNSFVQVKDKKIFEYINSILDQEISPKDIVAHSLVHKTKRIILKKSKIIVDIKTPNIDDHLKLLSFYNERLMEGEQETLGTMLYIKDIFIPNIARIKAEGRPVYTRLETDQERHRVICGLKEDGETLSSEISKRENELNVEYSINSFKCSTCKEHLGEIPINIEKLLFFQMEQHRKNLTETNQTK